MPRLLTEAAKARAGTQPADATDVLVSLLLLNEPMPKTSVEKFLGTEELSLLEDTRLLEIDGTEVRSDITVSEYGGMYFASDTVWRSREIQNGSEFRMPVADPVCNPLFGDSASFASIVPAQPATRCLDLCTGSGIVALIVAKSHQQVIGIDNSRRSLAFAEFNKALNGVSNVEFLESDMYAQVDGQFSRICANPPYLPCTDSTPGDNFYCGGSAGDSLTTMVLDGLDEHLADGGHCYLTGFFICTDAGNGVTRLSPDLLPYWRKNYDMLLLTCEVDFRDTSRVSSMADFGSATRVDYGHYVLRKRPAGVTGHSRMLHAPFDTKVPFDIEKLFCDLDASANPESVLMALNVIDLTRTQFPLP
jgi:hypothetical protein